MKTQPSSLVSKEALSILLSRCPEHGGYINESCNDSVGIYVYVICIEKLDEADGGLMSDMEGFVRLSRLSFENECIL